MQICFATNNLHKLSEVRALLSDRITLLSLNDIGCHEELPETQGTITGNSAQKASYVFDHYHVPCFADDSGLEVATLDGAPGVDSAHYAGPQRSSEDNITLLLRNLEGSPDRRARFRTVITLMGVEKDPVIFDGSVDGEILRERRGSQGFGYDPVFLPAGFDKTFAEMDLALKNSISHRAIAIRKLAEYLTRIQTGPLK